MALSEKGYIMHELKDLVIFVQIVNFSVSFNLKCTNGTSCNLSVQKEQLYHFFWFCSFKISGLVEACVKKDGFDNFF